MRNEIGGRLEGSRKKHNADKAVIYIYSAPFEEKINMFPVIMFFPANGCNWSHISGARQRKSTGDQ